MLETVRFPSGESAETECLMLWRIDIAEALGYIVHKKCECCGNVRQDKTGLPAEYADGARVSILPVEPLDVFLSAIPQKDGRGISIDPLLFPALINRLNTATSMLPQWHKLHHALVRDLSIQGSHKFLSFYAF